MMATLREVRLYGELGRRFGRLHRLAVTSAAEAVHALCVVLPGFERAFVGGGRGGYHVVVRRGAITVPGARARVGGPEPIRIVPVVAGSKRGGLLPILLGAALFFVAPY